MTDSKGLPDAHRPSVAEALSNPRDGLALVLLANGLAISALNLCGEYSEPYLALEVSASSLGFLSGAAALAQLATGYMIRPHRRRGIADDGLVTWRPLQPAVSWLPSARPTPARRCSGRSTPCSPRPSRPSSSASPRRSPRSSGRRG